MFFNNKRKKSMLNAFGDFISRKELDEIIENKTECPNVIKKITLCLFKIETEDKNIVSDIYRTLSCSGFIILNIPFPYVVSFNYDTTVNLEALFEEERHISNVIVKKTEMHFLKFNNNNINALIPVIDDFSVLLSNLISVSDKK
jgi:hypothetical protein